MKATTTLLDYLRGDVDSIEVDVRINGVTQEAFNDREKGAHGRCARAVSTCHDREMGRTGAGSSSAWRSSIVERAQAFPQRAQRRYCCRCRVLFILFLCLLGVWIMADFNGFWTTFHQLFFTNDLWLLQSRIPI